MTRPESKVYYAPTGDPRMDAVMERARATFKYFWRELTWEQRRIVPGLELAAIKSGFADPGGGPDDVEHMWLNEVTFDGDSIGATLVNRPNFVRSVREGNRVTLGPADVEDWMY